MFYDTAVEHFQGPDHLKSVISVCTLRRHSRPGFREWGRVVLQEKETEKDFSLLPYHGENRI